MHQRITPTRRRDRVLVVANLEDDWEPLIGWVLSRMQEGDVLYLLHLIQCQDGGQDGEECDGTCERSQAPFHWISQERYMRDRVALMVGVMRELGGFYLHIKVLTSKRIVHTSQLPSVIQEESHAVDATNVVLSGTGWYEGSALALQHACHPLLAQISAGLSPTCLITVVEGARLADVKRGRLGCADLADTCDWPTEKAAGEASWADPDIEIGAHEDLEGMTELQHEAYLHAMGGNLDEAVEGFGVSALEPTLSTASSIMARLRLPRLRKGGSRKVAAAEASMQAAEWHAKRQWGNAAGNKGRGKDEPIDITWKSLEEPDAGDEGGVLALPLDSIVFEDIMEDAEVMGDGEYREGSMQHESAIGHVDTAYVLQGNGHAVGSPAAYYTEKWDESSSAHRKRSRAQRRKGTPKSTKHSEFFTKGGSLLSKTLSILTATDSTRSAALDTPQALHDPGRMGSVSMFSSRHRY